MFQGSMVALVTPMTADGSVDVEALEHLVDFHVEAQTDAIVAMGTTGESATLAFDEHIDVVRRVVTRAAGRIPVIAGTGANATQEAIELTAAAKDVGADACLLVTPYYNKPTQEGLFLHHKAVADAVAIPQLLYNVPGRTACDMSVKTTVRLSEVENIIGIKDATGDMTRAEQLKASLPADFILLSGDDGTTIEFMKRGGKGTISVTANVAPEKMHRMCECMLQGKTAEAKAINTQLMPLHEKLFVEANPIPAKYAVQRMGLCQQGIRLPLTWLSESFHSVLDDAMQHAGIKLS